MARQTLRRGKHPTADDLTKMRLGYPGYEARLEAMRKLSPARYAAVMAGARHFDDPHWTCSTCHGVERFTRNLACRACASGRVQKVFHRVPGTDELVYLADSDSTDWHQRRQERLRLEDAEFRLRSLGTLRCGRFRLEAGKVWTEGRVVLDTLGCTAAADALLSGDRVQAAEAMRPVLEISRDLAVLVREIAARLLNTPKR